MKIILTGATGYVGEGTLLASIFHDDNKKCEEFNAIPLAIKGKSVKFVVSNYKNSSYGQN